MDLTLLLIFEAVMAELNVTRAAARLDMNQSSVSKGLSELRDIFNDPLFLRTAKGVVPTHRAGELAGSIHNAINVLSGLLASGTEKKFDPANARMVFNVAATDYVSFVLLPKLLKNILEVAPGIRIMVHDIGNTSPEEILLSGKADLVLSAVGSVTFPVYRQEIFCDSYVCLARENHPIAKDTMSTDVFRSCDHIAMPGQNGSKERMLADLMQRIGLSRSVPVHLPHFLSVPPILTNTNLIITIARKIAEDFCKTYPLKVFEHPLPLDKFGIYQLWHDRTNLSESHQWFRKTIIETCQHL